MLRHSFGDGSPSLGCCIGGESPPLVSSFPFFVFLLRAERRVHSQGGDLFLFTHLLERCPFYLFIYLERRVCLVCACVVCRARACVCVCARAGRRRAGACLEGRAGQRLDGGHITSARRGLDGEGEGEGGVGHSRPGGSRPQGVRGSRHFPASQRAGLSRKGRNAGQRGASTLTPIRVC